MRSISVYKGSKSILEGGREGGKEGGREGGREGEKDEFTLSILDSW